MNMLGKQANLLIQKSTPFPTEVCFVISVRMFQHCKKTQSSDANVVVQSFSDSRLSMTRPIYQPVSANQYRTIKVKALIIKIQPQLNYVRAFAAGTKSTSTKLLNKRKKRIISTSEDETISMSNCGGSTTTAINSTSTFETYEEEVLQDDVESSLSAPYLLPIITSDDISIDATEMDTLKVVLSPLTEEKIREINTPKKKFHMPCKASQTEISGLTVKIPWERIDFNSEYFRNLRRLLEVGTKRGNKAQHELVNNFADVVIPNRAIGSKSPSPPPLPILSPNVAVDARTNIDDLLYHRSADEVNLPADKSSEDRFSSSQMVLNGKCVNLTYPELQILCFQVKSVRSAFRIPKISKQKSDSPETVTSSTSHLTETKENEKSVSKKINQTSSEVRSEEREGQPEFQPMPSIVRADYCNDDPAEGCSYTSTTAESRSAKTVSPMRFANAVYVSKLYFMFVSFFSQMLFVVQEFGMSPVFQVRGGAAAWLRAIWVTRSNQFSQHKANYTERYVAGSI